MMLSLRLVTLQHYVLFSQVYDYCTKKKKQKKQKKKENICLRIELLCLFLWSYCLLKSRGSVWHRARVEVKEDSLLRPLGKLLAW